MAGPRQRALDFGPVEHFQLLHGGHRLSVPLATRTDGLWWQALFPHTDAPAVLMSLAGEIDADTYMGQSGHRGDSQRRTVASVEALPGLFVDMDHYKLPDLAHLDAPELLRVVLDAIPTLPLPTLLVSSGRGAYFVWVFDKPLGRARLAEWQHVETELVDLLKPWGADPAAKDAARVLRVPGSVHTGTGERVWARMEGGPVLFSTMKMAVLEEAAAARARARQAAGLRSGGRAQFMVIPGDGTVARKRKAGVALNDYQLALDRMSDLKRLVELRGGRLADGRARALFVYAVCASWYCTSVSQLQDECEAFAAVNFVNPGRYGFNRLTTVAQRFRDDGEGKVRRLRLYRMVADGCGALRRQYQDEGTGRYKLTNLRILELLEVTEAEQRQLKTIISPAEKARRLIEKRRAAGVMSRQQYTDRAAQRRAKAAWMRADGMAWEDIAERLGVTVGSAKVLAHRGAKAAAGPRV